MSIFIRTVPNVMQFYGCSAEDAHRFIDLRDEGYSTDQAAIMAGLSDPPEDDDMDMGDASWCMDSDMGSR